MVNDAVILGLSGSHVVIAVGIAFDQRNIPARVFGQNFIYNAFPAQDFPGRDRNVRGLPGGGPVGW